MKSFYPSVRDVYFVYEHLNNNIELCQLQPFRAGFILIKSLLRTNASFVLFEVWRKSAVWALLIIQPGQGRVVNLVSLPSNVSPCQEVRRLAAVALEAVQVTLLYKLFLSGVFLLELNKISPGGHWASQSVITREKSSYDRQSLPSSSTIDFLSC